VTAAAGEGPREVAAAGGAARRAPAAGATRGLRVL
jgi:hypothetical protein